MLQLSSSEAMQRKKLVEIAYSWLGTPYHPMGRVKGAGVDCLTLLAEIFTEAGLVPPIYIPFYPQDWHLHRAHERYMDGLQRYAHETDAPLPGDIALWKFGRCYSHGAIVIQWPLIIHAYVGRACTLENVASAHWLSHMGEVAGDTGKKRPVKFFSVFRGFENEASDTRH